MKEIKKMNITMYYAEQDGYRLQIIEYDGFDSLPKKYNYYIDDELLTKDNEFIVYNSCCAIVVLNLKRKLFLDSLDNDAVSRDNEYIKQYSDDYEVVSRWLTLKYSSIKFICSEFLNDYQLMLNYFIKEYSLSSEIKYVSNRLLDNKAFIVEILIHRQIDKIFISDRLSNDIDIITLFKRYDGY